MLKVDHHGIGDFDSFSMKLDTGATSRTVTAPVSGLKIILKKTLRISRFYLKRPALNRKILSLPADMS